MIKTRNIKSPDSLGFRKVFFKKTVGDLTTELVLDKIEIVTETSNQYILVNYTKIESYESTGKTYFSKGSYKLKDIVGIEEYEVDENGNEIEGSARVIQEEKPYVSNWDKHLGEAISAPTAERMASKENLL